MKKIAIVTGASGLVGMQLLHQLFQEKRYDSVITLGRRELTLKHPKLIQVLVKFDQFYTVNLVEKLREKNMGGDYQYLIQALQDKKLEIHAFSALGTTAKKAGSKENFYKVDHDYVIAFAKWAHALGAGKFLYVSAIGADQTSSIFYNKVKGEVEEDLKLIPFKYLGIFQPSLLLGNRRETRLGEEAGKVLMKAITVFGLFKKYKPIYGYQVAKAMVHYALQDNNKVVQIISSKEMQQFK